MDERERIRFEEESAWRRFHAVVERIPPEAMAEPTVTPEGWAPKDLLFHVGCWLADAACQLEAMRFGTFSEPELDIEVQNREWFEISHGLDVVACRAELESSRVRMVEEWGQLPEQPREIDVLAREWFEESGALHYEKHRADLEAWLAARER